MQVLLALNENNIGLQIVYWVMRGLYWILAQIVNVCDIIITTVRALAGLEVYSYGSSTVNPSDPAQGDIVINFLQEQGLINIFISLFVLAIVLLFIVTFINVIKSEWSPVNEAKGNNKYAVISKSIRALINFITVPVVAILGIIVGNELLKALDGATNGTAYTGMSNLMMRCVTENATLVNYNDSNSKTLIQENLGTITIDGESYRGIYSLFITSGGFNATAINKMFETSAQVPTDVRIKLDEVPWLPTSIADNLNEKIAAGEAYFSYQDTDMVSLFFKLEKVDYLSGFVVFFIVTKYLFIISFGLVKRIYSISVLLLVSPPVVAITPLQPDALKNWRKYFIQNVLAAYGSIVGCNLYFILLPYIRNINLFKNLTLLNNFITLMFIAAGAIFIQDFGKLVNDIIGGSDLYKESSDKGKSLWTGVAETAGKNISTIAGAPVRAYKDGANFVNTVRYKGWGDAIKNTGNNIKNTATKKSGFLSGLSGGLNPINALDKDTEKAVNEGRQEVRTRKWEDKTGMSTARETLEEEIKNDQGKLDVLNQNQARRTELENLEARTEDEENELKELRDSADEEKQQKDALEATLKKSKEDLELLSKVKVENGKIKGNKQMPKGTWKKAREEREKAKQENKENVEKVKEIIKGNDARAKKIVEQLADKHGEEDAKKDYDASQNDKPSGLV